jgi:hypothetical protein
MKNAPGRRRGFEKKVYEKKKENGKQIIRKISIEKKKKKIMERKRETERIRSGENKRWIEKS